MSGRSRDAENRIQIGRYGATERVEGRTVDRITACIPNSELVRKCCRELGGGTQRVGGGVDRVGAYLGQSPGSRKTRGITIAEEQDELRGRSRVKPDTC